jgi:small subunit ribosomal protein S1
MNPESKSLSFSLEDFEQALSAHDYSFQKGQTVKGLVAEHSSEGVYVDIGGKAAAFLPLREASLQPIADVTAALPIGEEHEFLVIRDQNDDGQVTLSRRQLQVQQIWEQLQEMQESKSVLQVRVNGTNRGGVTVDVEGLRGFIPRSHLMDKENLEALKGQQLTVTFLEVDRERNKVVLSERLASQSKYFAQLEIGQLIEGQVTSLKPFGVFISFGGTTGLLHINQVSNKYVNALPELFSPGQDVRAMIIDIDEGRGRIALATKHLENYPGEMLENLQEVMDAAPARLERAKKQLSI